MNLSSAGALNLDKSKILSFGKALRSSSAFVQLWFYTNFFSVAVVGRKPQVLL